MQLIVPGKSGTKRVGVHPVTGAVYPEVAIGSLAPGVGQPYNGMVLATANPDYPRGMVNGSGATPAPRAGFAYDVFGDGSTAVRGGFGLFFGGYATELFSNYFVRQPPLTQVPIIYYSTIAQLKGSQGLAFPSANTYSVDPAGTLPATLNFSLSVQRRLWGGTLLDVGYVGSLARHLQWMRGINDIRVGANFLPQNQDATSPGKPLPASFLRPIPGYGVISNIEMAGSSNYHSLQAGVRRRFAQRLQFGAVWTWSKAMDFNDTDQSSVTNLVNLRSWSYGLAAFDRTHIVKLNYLYDLPNLRVRHPVLRGVLHGWQASGITSFISGQPFGIDFNTTPVVDISGTPDLAARPIAVGPVSLPKDQRTFDRYFDTSVFRLPAQGTLGNLGKTVFRGPGVNNWDIALAKGFRLTEKVNVRFRCEAYNTFNHTQFSALGTTAQFNSATGAQTNAAFGRISATRSPRNMQLNARVTF